MPLFVAPVPFHRMVCREGERASIRAAGAAGTAIAITRLTSEPLESLANAARSPLWFQLFKPPDEATAKTLLRRVEDAGVGVVCLTVDSPVGGLAERARRSGVTIPFRVTPRLVMGAAVRPRWSLAFLRGHLASAADRAVRGPSMKDLSTAVARNLRDTTLDDVRWLRDNWPGRLVVKGVMSGHDASLLAGAGIDGIVVSNHGGRQLDGLPATIEVLPEIVDAVNGNAEVLVDGGFRRGADVVKALALGARACLVGRPVMYGLAVGGSAGAERVLSIFRNEIEHTMALLGVRTVDEITRDLVVIDGPVAVAERGPGVWE
jgi:isopentenyl diphosphate isomerase/L-lactate dehydrogenase-like FMN-dependent dehydrogenase